MLSNGSVPTSRNPVGTSARRGFSIPRELHAVLLPALGSAHSQDGRRPQEPRDWWERYGEDPVLTGEKLRPRLRMGVAEQKVCIELADGNSDHGRKQQASNSPEPPARGHCQGDCCGQ